MEQVVQEMLPSILKLYPDICKCEKCIDDIQCITLNNVKTAYFRSEMGGILLKVNSLQMQYKTDVINETTKAIKIVSQNVRHDS